MMEASRRNFIKGVGLTGLAAMSFPGIITAADSKLKRNDDHKGLTILFQGDSITHGNRTLDNDWNHVMGHGYAYLIASRLWYDYPEKDLMFYNRGISGNQLRDLEGRWQKDALDLNPDVISILIGVNDVYAIVNNSESKPIEEFEEAYRRILDKTMNVLPKTKFVLCEPFILPLGMIMNKMEVWKEEVKKRQLVVRKLADEYQTIHIELQEPFNNACEIAQADYWIWDGIHPMPAGHELIARKWIKEAEEILTFIKE